MDILKTCNCAGCNPANYPETNGWRCGKHSGVAISGAELIVAERNRQIQKEGWHAGHDDDHDNGALAHAARCYLTGDTDGWPFEIKWWKSSDRVRDLVKAGALIAAEIGRLKREELAPKQANKA